MFHRVSLSMALAAAGILVSAASYAADIPVYEPPAEVAPLPPASWTGLYLGIAGGGGASAYDTDFNIGALNLNIDGFGGEGWLVEGRAGFDFQVSPAFVIGVLGDGRWSEIETEASLSIGGATVASAQLDTEWSADALGRAGILVTDNALVYALGGWTWQHFNGEAAVPGLGIAVEDDEDSSGPTVGAGIEVRMFGSNASVLLEYRYAWLDEIDFGTGGVVEIDPSLHTGRIGFNYKFGGLLGR